MTLNELMEFGTVVLSDGAGNVSVADRSDAPAVYEVVYLTLDADGQSTNDDVQGLYEGWTLLSGFTGQHGYNGPVMHDSEYIGGGMESHIRTTAGYYVALIVDGLPDDQDADENVPIGWAVAYRGAP